MQDKDWSARFKFSERKPVPNWLQWVLDWLLWVLVCAIPFGPWYVDLPITIVAALIVWLKIALRRSSNS